MACSQLGASQALPTALRRGPGARPRGGGRARHMASRAAATAPPTTGLGSCHGGAHLSSDEKAHLEKIAAMIGTPVGCNLYKWIYGL
jgi:hypothetical protein